MSFTFLRLSKLISIKIKHRSPIDYFNQLKIVVAMVCLLKLLQLLDRALKVVRK